MTARGRVTTGAIDLPPGLTSDRTVGSASRSASNVRFLVEFTALFGVGLPLILARRPIASISTVPHVLTFALCVFAAGRLATTLAKGRTQYMTMSFYIFVYCWFGLAGFLQLDADFFAIPERYLGRSFSGSTRLIAIGVIWLGIVAYEVGQAVGTSKKRRRVRPSDAKQHRVLSAPRVRLLSLCSFAVGLPLLVREGPGSLFANREAFADTFGKGPGGGYVVLLEAVGLRLIPFAAAYMTLVILNQHGGLRWSEHTLAQKLLAVCTIAFALVVNNVFSSSRNLVGALFLAFAFAVLRPGNIRLRRLVFAGLVLGILVAFPYANRFRREAPITEQSRSIRDSILEAGDFSMYGQVHTAVEYVDNFGTTNGRQVATAAFFLVPRSAWQGKSIDTGDLTHDALGYPSRLNQSSPLWAEFYVDGGLLLVAGGFGAYGVFTARLQRSGARAGSCSAAGLIMPVVAAHQLYFLRGSLLAFVPKFSVLLLLLWICTRKPSNLALSLDSSERPSLDQ